MKSTSVFVQIIKLLVVSWSSIEYTCARRVQYPEDGYYGNNFFDAQSLDSKVNAALQRLEHTPKWVKDWPDPSVQMGQVSGLALDTDGHLLVFHRDNNVWDERTFTPRNVYQGIGEPPISRPTILKFNDTGELIDSWGENLFYIPHGITVDREGNVWLTDVAMHQVFKFTPDQRQKPALVLGEKFIPGNDDQHFCKPTSVAVMSNGDFFVADGYCNHRILKYSPKGEIILQWGKAHGRDNFVFNVPHALTLAEDRGLLCAGDRERGRVACFRSDNGTFAHNFASWLIGSRLFSVAYSPAQGGRLYVVNGPYGTSPVPVRGYVIDFTSGALSGTFAPDGGLHNPHDVVATPDGGAVYVAEINPYRVHKFVDDTIQKAADVTHAKVAVKPTATVGK
ncbi:peptidyl-alpha-hydroxyglycine alpha-amidating lyase 1 [Ostrinia furnacalis]|uniref:peptidyl-alpha-hydroxyglycine alpha-amidating lyase 1 n=1 Tax=Ostrinia furnacalis TaxID=93504 RepID=UPI00103A076A|nr:peptidyl-alpha-hydroxyglycine alpha-amidating lyase 1 [Ostrinia furnacalis]